MSASDPKSSPAAPASEKKHASQNITGTKIRSGKPVGYLIAGLAVLGVLALALFVNRSSFQHPTTDSGTITADVVQIGAEVGGRVKGLYIETDQHVRKGQLLYEIDPEPYVIALHQAQANAALAEAGYDSQKRQMRVASANAAASADALHAAQANQGLAARTVARLAPLARQSYVSWQQFDQARTHLRDADNELAAAKQRNAAAITAIGDLKRSEATLASSRAVLAQAQYNLNQTRVYAPQDGYVASLDVRSGELLAPHQVLFTLITDSTWYAMANIRELDLPPIKPGDCATVYSMINRHIPMKGTVLSIGWGVLSDDYKSIPTSVPYVARQMDWVHVAQRFPVRVRIDTPHVELLRMGATANIEMKHGAACRP
ncbi:multidrug transporter subunit MdtN [Oecophyllibacter saccharovorans]|uniref:multidrug transporter subunit MdtN n=1 Tax=Oecophyllibacter saccharovorans TaxID=2558360 RepID=UPI00116E99F5|nr:multidrug transporter subunit MdtN [Oecophyllibacter saccharovorans]TPW35069.1 multidrug transporter subunit MdtN [Oecophyllibacter saccharovorans]